MLLDNTPFDVEYRSKVDYQQKIGQNPAYSRMDALSKDLFYWINVLREDPIYFADTIIPLFLRSYPSADTSNIPGLLTDLRSSKQLPHLLPDAMLMKASMTHAYDLMTNSKSISHYSSDGKDFSVRMNEAGVTTCASENLYFGKPNALLALVLLLIDHGVPDFGHRKAILEPEFVRMGSAFKINSDGYAILVQQFMCN